MVFFLDLLSIQFAYDGHARRLGYKPQEIYQQQELSFKPVLK